MAFVPINAGRVPSILRTRNSAGVWVEQEEPNITYSLVVYGQHSDVVRRKKPADPFGAGTGWTFAKYENTHGIGYQKISDIQSRVALSNRWWSGSGNAAGFDHQIDLPGKLRAAVKSQNVNLAQALGEYRQTADLFSRAATDVYAAFRSLRSGRGLSDIARYLKAPRSRKERDLASQWLRYQYGLKPVISDVYGAAAELNRVLSEGAWVYVNLKSQSSRSGQAYWPDKKDIWGSSTWNIDFDVKLKARYKIADGGVKQLSQVGITNPLATAWELVPYSFVVDWLFPVGNWLSSLDALVGTSSLSYYTVVRARGRESGSTYGGPFTRNFDGYSRDGPYTNVPLPRLRYEPSTSLTKVVNGLALLRNLRK